jgi:hypothetical protein
MILKGGGKAEAHGGKEVVLETGGRGGVLPTKHTNYTKVGGEEAGGGKLRRRRRRSRNFATKSTKDGEGHGVFVTEPSRSSAGRAQSAEREVLGDGDVRRE